MDKVFRLPVPTKLRGLADVSRRALSIAFEIPYMRREFHENVIHSKSVI